MKDFFRYAIRANVVIFLLSILAALGALSVVVISVALGVPWQATYLGMVTLSLIIAAARIVRERNRTKNARQ